MAAESATEQEYGYQLSQAKALAKEYHDAVPESIKERVKNQIKHLADLCAQMGIPKHKVISKIYVDLGGDEDSFYKLRHLYNILDPSYQIEPDSCNNANSNVSSYTLTENDAQYLKVYEDYKELCETTILNIKLGLLHGPEDAKDFRIFIMRAAGFYTVVKQGYDDRMLIPVAAQPLLLQMAMEYTIADAYSRWVLKFKDIIKRRTEASKIRGIRTTDEMSGKRTHQIVYKRVRDIHDSMQPVNSDEARFDGFTGQQCPECKHWRIDRFLEGPPNERTYECLDCGHRFKGKIIPAYQKPNSVTLNYISDTNTTNYTQLNTATTTTLHAKVNVT